MSRARPRPRPLNDHATFYPGTGCIQFSDGGVIELTVAEEELFELLLLTPKITVSYSRILHETAHSQQTLRHLMRQLRNKLGARAVKTHTAKGISLQPQFVGVARIISLRSRGRVVG